MSKTPYMKFYVSDFLGDTLHLTPTEIGQYVLLLSAMWNSGGPLDNDPKLLHRICRSKPRPRVLEFFTVKDGKLTQERLQSELELRHQRALVGASGGRSKAANALKKKDTALPNGLANGYPHSPESIVHSPNRYIDTPKGVSPPKRDAYSGEFERFWKIYPRRIGKRVAYQAFKNAKRRASVDEICAGISHIDTTKDPKYLPHASTWLNRDGWLDEPEKNQWEDIHELASTIDFDNFGSEFGRGSANGRGFDAIVSHDSQLGSPNEGYHLTAASYDPDKPTR